MAKLVFSDLTPVLDKYSRNHTIYAILYTVCRNHFQLLFLKSQQFQKPLQKVQGTLLSAIEGVVYNICSYVRV